MDRVRVLRIIEYEGPRDWVEATLEEAFQGTRRMEPGRFIRVVTIGTFPEIMEERVRITHRCNSLYLHCRSAELRQMLLC